MTSKQYTEPSVPASLSLYHTPYCPYCLIVRREMKRLGVSAELRSLYDDAQYPASLMTELGRTTVPVLRIQGTDGSVTWMPESADIIDYLRQQFSKA